MKSELIVFLGLILLSSLVGAADCSSNYVCKEWGKCLGGYQERICEDSACGMKDITERQFCGENEGCAPKIECLPWNECVYTEKINNFLQGEIKFGGYKTRTCSDASGCIETFVEESSCEEKYDLTVEKMQECGTNYLVVSDPSSKKVLAKIDLDSWKSKRLDILFSDRRSSCGGCFNAVKDGDEEGVDCGGSCAKECKTQTEFPVEIVSFSSWILFFVFGTLITREVVKNAKKIH
jgi:hypothetical protein